MDEYLEAKALDCPDAAPSGAPVLSSLSAQGYPASPWKFGEHEKQKFLEWEKVYGANSWLYAWVDRYMISRAGEYVHPKELHDAMKKQGYDGDVQSLLIRLQVRASKYRIGDYVYRPCYLIVRPHKPRGLPKSTLAPLVLVPFSLADEVIADESWALHLLQRETHDRTARAAKIRKRGSENDVFLNFFHFFDLDLLTAISIGQVQKEESSEQRAELDDVLRFVKKTRVEIEKQMGKANAIVLPSADEPTDSDLDVLWERIMQIRKIISPALDFARLDILIDDYEKVSVSPVHLEEKNLGPEWELTVVDRTHVDFIPGTSKLVLLKPTRPHQDLTTAAERSKPESLFMKHRKIVKPRGEEAFSISVGNGESDADLPYFTARTGLRSQEAIAASKMLLNKPSMHELFAEWVSKFKGLETLEHDADMCTFGISDPARIAELRDHKIDQFKLDSNYYVRDALRIFGHHIGEEMTVQRVCVELRTVAGTWDDAALLKKLIVGMDQSVLLTIVKQALIEASQACQVLGIRKLGSVKKMQDVDVDSFVLHRVDADIYRLAYIIDAYDVARDDSAFRLAFLDTQE